MLAIASCARRWGREPERDRLEAGLEDGFQDEFQGGLHDPVSDGRWGAAVRRRIFRHDSVLSFSIPLPPFPM
jgi:hypothetical protein